MLNKQKNGWLAVQRLSVFLYLSCGVLLLIYALGFLTRFYLFYTYGGKGLENFYHEMQIVNNSFLWKAVLAVVFSLALFILELGKHPAGFFTLIAVCLIALASIFFCADSFLILADAKAQYRALDFDSLNRYIERGTINYESSTLTFDLGLAGYALFLSAVLFMAFTVIRNAFAVKPESEKGGINEK